MPWYDDRRADSHKAQVASLRAVKKWAFVSGLSIKSLPLSKARAEASIEVILVHRLLLKHIGYSMFATIVVHEKRDSRVAVFQRFHSTAIDFL